METAFNYKKYFAAVIIAAAIVAGGYAINSAEAVLATLLGKIPEQPVMRNTPFVIASFPSGKIAFTDQGSEFADLAIINPAAAGSEVRISATQSGLSSLARFNDAAVNSAGQIYAIDNIAGNIRVFNESGTQLFSFTHPDFSVIAPISLTVGPSSGKIYVGGGPTGNVNTGNFLYRFSPAGVFEASAVSCSSGIWGRGGLKRVAAYMEGASERVAYIGTDPFFNTRISSLQRVSDALVCLGESLVQSNVNYTDVSVNLANNEIYIAGVPEGVAIPGRIYVASPSNGALLRTHDEAGAVMGSLFSAEVSRDGAKLYTGLQVGLQQTQSFGRIHERSLPAFAITRILGTTLNPLSAPHSLARDGQGNLWSANLAGINRVIKTDPAGNNVLLTLSDPNFNVPRDVAAAPDGNSVYVVDVSRVYRFNLSGVKLAERVHSAQLDGAQVAVDPATGDVYVLHTAPGVPQAFWSKHSAALDATLIPIAGSYGAGDGQFVNPVSIAVTSDGVFIPDSGNHQVDKFSKAGAYLGSAMGCDSGSDCNLVDKRSKGFTCAAATCGRSGVNFGPQGQEAGKCPAGYPCPGQFNGPSGIAHINGQYYISDFTVGSTRNPRIQVLKDDGIGFVEQTVFNAGSGDNQFFRIAYLDSAGADLYVIDPDQHRGSKYSVAAADTTSPETTITSSPPASTVDTSATFAFSSNEAGSIFECQLDGGVFAPCVSPKTYTGLAAGSHTFSVRAKDAAGNVDATPASFSWTITTADTTPPETTITSSPAAPTNSASATFTFTSSEISSAFTCKLDVGPAEPCASPKTYTGLADGSHTFTVAAKDAAGNTDPTPASFTWMIDSVPPETTITSAPASPTNSNSATIAFSSNEGGAAFTCQLDANAAENCVSPKTYAGLTDGSHTVSVTATDAAGNADPTPASGSFTVDTTTPVSTSVTSPASPNGQNSWFTTNVGFTVTGSDGAGSGVATVYACADQANACNPQLGLSGATSVSGTITTEGVNYIRHQAKDAAGNLSAVGVSQVNVDKTAPAAPVVDALPQFSNSDLVNINWPSVIDSTSGTNSYEVYRCEITSSTLTCAPANLLGLTNVTGFNDPSVKVDDTRYFYAVKTKDNAGLVSGLSNVVDVTVDKNGPLPSSLAAISPTGFIKNLPAVLNWSAATDPGVLASGVAFYKIYRDVISGSLTILNANVGNVLTYSDATLSEAIKYFFKVTAQDKAGNPGGLSNEVDVTLDQTAPVTAAQLTPATPNGNGGFYVTPVGVTLNCQDTISGCQANGTKFSLDGSPEQIYTGPFLVSNDGNHTVFFFSTDNAGNIEAQKSVSWKIDTTSPETTVTSAPPPTTSETTATLALSSSEAGSTFECSLDGVAFSPCTSPKTYSGLSIGSHTFSVRARDAAGNVDATPATAGWSIVIAVGDTDGDGIEDTIDLEPTVFSNKFSDGTTFGEITDRSTYSVTVSKTDTGVKILVSGSGTTAKVKTCDNAVETQYNTNGETADITCGPNSTTIKAVSGSIKWRKPPTGRGTRGTITAPNTFTISGDPLVIADAANTSGELVEVVDEADIAVASCTIKPADRLDVNSSDVNSFMVLSNIGSAAIACAINDAAVNLLPGQTIVDQCFSAGGNVSGTGCPVADKNIVTLHNVFLGGGSSSKAPLPGASIRVFDRNSPEFQTVAGSKNPDGSLYGVIYEANAGKVGSCVTGSDGTCLAGESKVGDYLVIVKYFDSATGKTVYVGRPKSPTDFVDTNADGLGDLATKDFQIIKVLKNGVFMEYRGGSKIVVTGSMLEMIVPESAIWEGTQSIYPFIFNSDSDWTVDVCVNVPTGYNLVGVYDETGNLVATTNCAQSLVTGQTKVVAFELKEVASPEPSLDVDIKTKDPKGKVTNIKHRVSDIRKASFEAKVKEAKIKIREQEMPNGRFKITRAGASLWSLVKYLLGLEVSDKEVMDVAKKIAQANSINVPEWGINDGKYDAKTLSWGFTFDLNSVADQLLVR